MKKTPYVLALALCGLTTFAHAAVPNLIPLPAQLSQSGEGFTVTAQTPIVVDASDAEARRTAEYLASLTAHTRHLPMLVKTGAPESGAIVLKRDPQAPVANAEGYTLDVTPQGIRIVARDGAGLFYGAITAWQLLTPEPGVGDVHVAPVHIRDEPRFAWRGFMLDSARHFQAPDDVRTVIDQMAQHKLNVLHWHLTDDQGWRIEIKRYPELTRIGAWRTPPTVGKQAAAPKPYGGFYTQDEIRSIVAYAAERHITVLPELDMPGHAQAAVASYPELGVTGTRPAVSPDWGVNPYLYNVDDNTLHFLQNVLDEVMALFPSTYIHVGGDEAVKDQWKASPVVQARMRALGIKTEDAMQSWFIEQMGQYLAAHNRRLIGWDEILEGGVPPSATVMSWRGTKGAIDAARLGHDVVLAPAPQLYLDSMQSDLPDETTGRLPSMSLQSYYLFEAVPKELSAAQAKHVLGLQATAFTEHMPTLRHVEHAAFPRMDALSEAAWTPSKVREWHGFLERMPAQLARYRTQDIAYADSAFAPTVDVDRNAAITSGHASVKLSNQARFGNVHYTTDGSEPGASSPLYVRPFNVNLPTTVKAIALADDGTPLAATRTRLLDLPSLRTRSTGELENCAGSDFRLRVQPTPDATSMAPTYLINVFDNCRVYRAAKLDGIASIRVETATLPRNYALAHDAKLVVNHKASTPQGELVVHLDNCKGKEIASLPLPADAPATFTLQGALAKQAGTHDLCLVFTSPITGPIWGVGAVTLLPGDAAP
ncbi:family 20 glycosylhydrolase [Dyella japonica]|uniref:beta-N-acetylhexosaminidase n=1 Tax=Dyella japonica A8 TaxID=1217721 RepID=A0A075JX92_9GAMM|nr:family 20 glycosylhydrolase [Dyella japonica]AIF46180.1 beta-hexosaminidase [Dyella japonica A8]